MPTVYQVATADPHLAERVGQREFVLTHAVLQFRECLAVLHDVWEGSNRDHFGGRLLPPHITIGGVSPRAFSECRAYTGYGARSEIRVSEGIVFGTNRRVVRAAFPAEGVARLLGDLVLREAVRQFVREVERDEEAGYDGYGPRFVAHANRIGGRLGLAPVVARLRRGMPVSAVPASRWPWGVRPEGFYSPEVVLPPLGAARGGGRRATRQSATAMPHLFEYFLEQLNADPARLRRLLQRLIDSRRAAAVPGLAERERAPTDAQGNPVPAPAIDPDWLTFASERVPVMARFIREQRAWVGMPILADALEDAGCESGVLLDHLRAPHEHTSECWALHLLAPVEPE
jgi:hypothetical protein